MSVDLDKIENMIRKVKPDAIVERDRMDPLSERASRLGVGVQLKRDPGEAVLAVLGAVASPIGERVLDYLGDPLWTWASIKSRGFTYGLMKGGVLNDLFNAILSQLYFSSIPDESGLNYSNQDLMKILDKLSETTIKVTRLVSDDAGEIVMESFQEAVSNAIYSGIGGMLQSIANYRAGFMPPQNPIYGMGEDGFFVHTRRMIDQFNGYNIYTTIAMEAGRVVNDAKDAISKYDKVDKLLDGIEALSDIHSTIYEDARSIILSGVHSILESFSAYMHLIIRRVNELIGVILTGHRDRNILNVIGDEQYNMLLAAVDKELDFLSLEIDNMLDDVQLVIGELDIGWEDVIGPAFDGVQLLLEQVGHKIDRRISEFTDYVTWLIMSRKFQQVRRVSFCFDNPLTGGRLCGFAPQD